MSCGIIQTRHCQKDKYVKLVLTAYPDEQMRKRAYTFYQQMNTRSTVYNYIDKPIPKGIIEQCLLCLVLHPVAQIANLGIFLGLDLAIKYKIWLSAERGRARILSAPRSSWLDVLVSMDTNEHKPFLEIAPCLTVTFGHLTSKETRQKLLCT